MNRNLFLMDSEQMDKLEALAEAATPGPWKVRPEREYDRKMSRFVGANIGPDGESIRHNGDVLNGGMWVVEAKGPDATPNAAYIAAANPDVVLALIRSLREVDRASGACLPAGSQATSAVCHAEPSAAWEPSAAAPGDEVKLWAVVAYPGSRVTDVFIGGHKVQVPNDALESSWRFANVHAANTPDRLVTALAGHERIMREEIIPAIEADLRANTEAVAKIARTPLFGAEGADLSGGSGTLSTTGTPKSVLRDERNPPAATSKGEDESQAATSTRLRELSAWLSEQDADLRMPLGMIDPAKAADELEDVTRRLAAALTECARLWALSPPPTEAVVGMASGAESGTPDASRQGEGHSAVRSGGGA